MSHSLFCFGLGYTGRALAAALRDTGWQVAGTVRDPAPAADLVAAGVKIWTVASGQFAGDLATALAGTSHVLISVPPGPAGEAAVDPAFDLLAAYPDAWPASAVWLGYLSTTGVYGDRGGDWVDETDPLRPTSLRAERRVAAERAWLEFASARGVAGQVFRLAGIYGPGRSQLDAVRSGRARRVVKPDQVFSRIHVDDIVAVLRASMARPNPGAIYNVCDDEAAPPQDVVAFACKLLGVNLPPIEPFDSAQLSDMARSFYRDNKRVSNKRIKEELGIDLMYPNYRTGLENLLTQAERA